MSSSKVLIPFLPKKWAPTAAAELGVSESLVLKVGTGAHANAQVFDHLLRMAEANKQDIVAKELEFQNRLADLAK